MSASKNENATNNSEEYIPVNFTDPNIPHDRVLVVGKKKFYVFAGHLSFCSEVFHRMFNSEFKEKNEQEIELKEVDPETFHQFLKTLIPGNISAVDADNFSSIMVCAQRFMVPSIIALCRKFVISNIDRIDKFKLLIYAFECDHVDLKMKLVDKFFKQCGISPCTTGLHCSIFLPKCSRCGKLLNGSYGQHTYFADREDDIINLPEEIQAFLLQTLIKKNR